MVFGFFKKKIADITNPPKKFNYQCPMCSREYFTQFNPNDITDWDNKKPTSLTETQCEFCKTELEIYYHKEGRVFAVDKKWQEMEDKFYKEHSELEGEIHDLECELEDNEEENNEKKAGSIKKKIEMLQKRADKMEDVFDNKQDNYEVRSLNWHCKWDDKLDKLK